MSLYIKSFAKVTSFEFFQMLFRPEAVYKSVTQVFVFTKNASHSERNNFLEGVMFTLTLRPASVPPIALDGYKNNIEHLEVSMATCSTSYVYMIVAIILDILLEVARLSCKTVCYVFSSLITKAICKHTRSIVHYKNCKCLLANTCNQRQQYRLYKHFIWVFEVVFTFTFLVLDGLSFYFGAFQDSSQLNNDKAIKTTLT